MKKNVIILFILCFFLSVCKGGGETATIADIFLAFPVVSYKWNAEKFIKADSLAKMSILFDKTGIPHIKLGEPVPTVIEGCEIRKESYYAEGSEQPRFVVYRNGEKELALEPKYDSDKDAFTDTIDEIMLYSSSYHDADGIFPGKLLSDCPDSFKSKVFWISPLFSKADFPVVTLTNNNIQYILNGDYLKEMPKIKGDGAAVKYSDFKPEAKIEFIRIY